MSILVSKEILEERLQTCRACPLVLIKDQSDVRRDTIFQKLLAAVKDLTELECKVCGCPMKIRAKQSLIGCPKRKWRR